MTLTSKKIIPCPFCGNTVMRIADWLTDSKGRIVYWVNCCKCDATGTGSYNPEKAIELWNRHFDKRVIEIYKTVINHLRFHNGEFAAGRLDGNGLSVAIMNELALLNLTGIPNDSNGGQNK